MAHWTCGQCRTVFWADTEPFNGHRLSCAACWEKGCPLNGEPCTKCMHESKIQMILLGRMVNGRE